MTKEITKAFILQQLQDKFKMREFDPTKFLFSETVIPVYEIEQEVLKWEISHKELSITSATGFEFFAVPQTERWHLSSYDVIFLGAGAHTVSGVYVNRANSDANFYYLDLTAGQTESYIHVLNRSVILNAGDTINLNVDGYTSTQNLRMYIDVAKEEIR